MPKCRVIIDKDRCKGCEWCVVFCPAAILRMSSDLNCKGYHFAEAQHEGCNGCSQCTLICPDVAIEIQERQDGAEDQT